MTEAVKEQILINTRMQSCLMNRGVIIWPEMFGCLLMCVFNVIQFTSRDEQIINQSYFFK